MIHKINLQIADAIAYCSGLGAEIILAALERPKNKEFGDLAFPCFMLAKVWHKSPQESALRLSQEIKLPETVEAIVPTGPFVNFRFKRSQVIKEIVSRVLNHTLPTSFVNAAQERIVLEYSSPNIAKPFHVGHLRATLIGNSLDRIYRRLGFSTVSINHLGDWGTQFGFVWAGCKLWGKPEVPSVNNLVELYKKSTLLKEQQEKNSVPEELKSLPNVNEIARAYFIDLEKGEPYAVEFWKWCLDVSLDYLQKTYQRLGIKFDHYTGESFYSDKLEDIRQDLQQSGLLVESQGALGVELGDLGGFARIFTPDGRSLYLTRDLATAKYRAEHFKFTKALYVVGAPQALHFQQIKGVLKALGRDYADKIEHVAFGHVLGMKTRGEGGAIELNEFIDEAYERSLSAYQEQVSKRPEGLDENKVAEAVSLAAIIFSNLSRGRLKDVHFSWEHALEFQGDSGPYLLYAYARINGIKEKAAEAGITPTLNFDSTLLTEDCAYQLAMTFADCELALSRTIDENEPCHIASYSLELAKAFSKAYKELKVVGVESPLAQARLSLFEATRLLLAEMIGLLGIPLLERM